MGRCRGRAADLPGAPPKRARPAAPLRFLSRHQPPPPPPPPVAPTQPPAPTDGKKHLPSLQTRCPTPPPPPPRPPRTCTAPPRPTRAASSTSAWRPTTKRWRASRSRLAGAGLSVADRFLLSLILRSIWVDGARQGCRAVPSVPAPARTASLPPPLPPPLSPTQLLPASSPHPRALLTPPLPLPPPLPLCFAPAPLPQEVVLAAYLDRVDLCAHGFYATPDVTGFGGAMPFNYFTYGAPRCAVLSCAALSSLLPFPFSCFTCGGAAPLPATRRCWLPLLAATALRCGLACYLAFEEPGKASPRQPTHPARTHAPFRRCRRSPQARPWPRWSWTRSLATGRCCAPTCAWMWASRSTPPSTSARQAGP